MWMSGGTNTNEQIIDKNWKQQQQSIKTTAIQSRKPLAAFSIYEMERGKRMGGAKHMKIGREIDCKINGTGWSGRRLERP